MSDVDGMTTVCGPYLPTTPMPRQRAIYLAVPQVRSLDHWCNLLSQALNGATAFLVGSCLVHDGWRDVDVRVLLTDEAFDGLPIRPLDLNMLLSQWGGRMTGLPIDCQVQSMREWSEEDGPRNPRGFLPTISEQVKARQAAAPTASATPGAAP